jgi:RimJ/RimL family protein N-acetyltransferase
MLKTRFIKPQDVFLLELAYQQFSLKAEQHYGWALSTLPFSHFAQNLHSQTLEAIALIDTSVPDTHPQQQVVGFLLYRLEAHKAIEVNVIYLADGVSQKAAIDTLLKAAIPHWLTITGWQVVSYAMLGQQTDYYNTLPWYGFKAVGQSVVTLELTDVMAMTLLNQRKSQFALPEGFYLHPWLPEAYTHQTGLLIYEAFHTRNDTLFDPRFATQEGAHSLVSFIQSGIIGTLYPNYSYCLSTSPDAQDAQALIGFCFLVQADLLKGNIPLIGLSNNSLYRNKGLGKALLAQTIYHALDGLLKGDLPILEINATVDTDNFWALRMYRQLFFKEEATYAHAYLPREKAEAFNGTVWC